MQTAREGHSGLYQLMYSTRIYLVEYIYTGLLMIIISQKRKAKLFTPVICHKHKQEYKFTVNENSAVKTRCLNLAGYLEG